MSEQHKPQNDTDHAALQHKVYPGGSKQADAQCQTHQRPPLLGVSEIRTAPA